MCTMPWLFRSPLNKCCILTSSTNKPFHLRTAIELSYNDRRFRINPFPRETRQGSTRLLLFWNEIWSFWFCHDGCMYWWNNVKIIAAAIFHLQWDLLIDILSLLHNTYNHFCHFWYENIYWPLRFMYQHMRLLPF